MSSRQTKISSLFLLCCGHLAAALVLPALAFNLAPSYTSMYATWFFGGALLSQPLLLAVWATLPSAPVRVRVPSALYAGTLSFYIWILLYKFAKSEIEFYGQILLAWFLCFALLAGVLALVRWRFGWQIESAHPLWESNFGNRHQFSLKHLLLWTAGIALVVGLGSWFLGPADFFPATDTPLAALGLLLRCLLVGIFYAAFALSGLTSLGVLFDPTRVTPWLIVTGILAVVAPLIFAVAFSYWIHWQSPRATPVDLDIIIRLWQSAFLAQASLIASTLGTIALLSGGGWKPVSPATRA